STPTRRRRWSRPGRAPRSSPPAPPRGNRCASTSPRWRSCCATRGTGRLISLPRPRKWVRLLTRIPRDELERIGAGELRELVMPYRAGYTPAQRREIEAQLLAGELRAVVTTD